MHAGRLSEAGLGAGTFWAGAADVPLSVWIPEGGGIPAAAVTETGAVEAEGEGTYTTHYQRTVDVLHELRMKRLMRRLEEEQH